MFKCQHCHQSSDPGTDQRAAERPARVVVQTRRKVYAQRVDGHNRVIDNGGEGYETVREVMVHAACAPLVAVQP